MPSLIQSTSGNGTTFTLNGVTSGNNLFLFHGGLRNPSTGVALALPTDTQGTWSTAIAGTPSNTGSVDIASAIFYQENAAAGTHTVTPEVASGRRCSLAEWSGIKSSSSIDQTKDAKTNNSTQTSQVTGTTSATSQTYELVLIGLCLGANSGVADVVFTDPVSGFTTLHVLPNDLSDLASFHAYKTTAASGAQSATFNWTDNEANQGSHGNIATFKLSAPIITTQPVQAKVTQGSTANFSIVVQGNGTVSYQWKANGSNVGTNSSSYTTAATVASDNLTSITCVVTDDNGSVTSDAAYLLVNPTSTVAWMKA